MTTPMSPRLKTCLDQGDLLNLFPLLKTWTKEELKALIQDADDYFNQKRDEIMAGWQELSENMEVFINPYAMKAITDARDRKLMDAFGFVTEVCGVAHHYLAVGEGE